MGKESGNLNHGSTPATNYSCDCGQRLEPQFLFLLNVRVGLHGRQAFLFL